MTTNMTRTEADALKYQLEAALRERGLTISIHDDLVAGNASANWRVECPRRNYPADNSADNYGVKLILRPSSGSRVTKTHRSLKPMLTRIDELLTKEATNTTARDIEKFNRAQQLFDLGWCASRLGIVVRSTQGYPALHEVVLPTARNREGKKVVLNPVLYSPKHDVLVVSFRTGAVEMGYLDVRVVDTLLVNGGVINRQNGL